MRQDETEPKFEHIAKKTILTTAYRLVARSSPDATSFKEMPYVVVTVEVESAASERPQPPSEVIKSFSYNAMLDMSKALSPELHVWLKAELETAFKAYKDFDSNKIGLKMELEFKALCGAKERNILQKFFAANVVQEGRLRIRDNWDRIMEVYTTPEGEKEAKKRGYAPGINYHAELEIVSQKNPGAFVKASLKKMRSEGDLWHLGSVSGAKVEIGDRYSIPRGIGRSRGTIQPKYVIVYHNGKEKTGWDVKLLAKLREAIDEKDFDIAANKKNLENQAAREARIQSEIGPRLVLNDKTFSYDSPEMNIALSNGIVVTLGEHEGKYGIRNVRLNLKYGSNFEPKQLTPDEVKTIVKDLEKVDVGVVLKGSKEGSQ